MDAVRISAPDQVAPAKAARLGLGTVQFGLRYGIAHADDRPAGDVARAVLARAVALGVAVADTAPRYGDAESVLGSFDGRSGLRIVTKTDADLEGTAVATSVRRGLERSLARLGVPCCDALLEHDAARLADGRAQASERWRAMVELRERGLVARLGVSVYDADTLHAVLEHFPVQVVQLPLSVVDRRMLDSGAIERLVDKGVDVHVRSLLLQGALVAPDGSLAGPRALVAAAAAFGSRCRDVGCTPLEGALAWAARAVPAATLLVGAQDVAQLEAIASAVDCDVDPRAFDGLASNDPNVVDPRTWSLRA